MINKKIFQIFLHYFNLSRNISQFYRNSLDFMQFLIVLVILYELNFRISKKALDYRPNTLKFSPTRSSAPKTVSCGRIPAHFFNKLSARDPPNFFIPFK